MRLLVTRPEPQATHWAEALRAQGLDAWALPLIAIDGPADPDTVTTLWRHLDQHRLLMFVSPAAVEWFFRLRPTGQPWPAGTLAASPGPGTSRVLLQFGAPAGLQPEQILAPPSEATQFDSEALWPVLRPLDWQARSVRIISGGDQQEAQGRTWLADQLRAQGAHVEAVLSYRRGPGNWTPAQQALARQALQSPAQHLWLFSSSQAIDHLAQHLLPGLPQCPPVDWSQATALCTHPRITARARQLGVGHILEARPTLDAVVQALRPPCLSRA